MRWAILILAAALAGCGEDEPRGDTPYLPEGRVSGLYPVDRERAIVVVDERHVIAVDAAGSVRWWRTLPVEIPLHDGVQIAEGVVTVRGVAAGEASIAALDLATGRPLWTTSLGPVPDSFVPVDHALMSLVVPGRVLEARDDGTLIVLDRRDGRELARGKPGYDSVIQQPIAAGADTVVHASSGDLLVHRLDAGTATWLTEVGSGHGCLRDGHYVVIESTDARTDLLSVDLQTLARTGWTNIPAGGDRRGFYAFGCGVRDGRLIFVGGTVHGVAILAIDAATGALVARHDLDGEHFRDIGTEQWSAGHGLIDGALPRHVAFGSEQYRTLGEMEDAPLAVLVVDLDTGGIVQRIPADTLEVRDVFKLEQRFVMLGWRGSIRAIDLETGRIAEHAVPETWVEVRPHHLVDGHYWSVESRWPGYVGSRSL